MKTTKIKCSGMDDYGTKCLKLIPKNTNIYLNGKEYCSTKCFNRAKEQAKPQDQRIKHTWLSALITPK